MDNALSKRVNLGLYTLNTLLGILILYLLYTALSSQIDYAKTYSKQLNIDFNPSISRYLLFNWFYITIGILLSLTPLFYRYKKTIGWLISFNVWIVIFLALVPYSIDGITNPTVTFLLEINTPIYFIFGLLISFVILILWSLNAVKTLNNIRFNLWFKSVKINLSIHALLIILQTLHLI